MKSGIRKGKKAFTMIEVIFVIVIIGILAAVAIPKLAATRDDAKMTRRAQATMTSASEIAAYVVAKGRSETNMSKMSNTLRLMIYQDEARQVSDTPPTVNIRWKDISNCLVMKIEEESNGTRVSKILIVEANGTNTNEECDRFRSLIDTERFPIPLRGTIVSY